MTWSAFWRGIYTALGWCLDPEFVRKQRFRRATRRSELQPYDRDAEANSLSALESNGVLNDLAEAERKRGDR